MTIAPATSSLSAPATLTRPTPAPAPAPGSAPGSAPAPGTSPGSTPETDPRFAHDCAWAARGCRVVRPGHYATLQPAAEGLYLLLGADDLVTLPMAPVRETLNWLRPDLLVVRLQAATPDATGRGGKPRLMLTTDPVLARQWRRGNGGPRSRQAIRQAVPPHRRWTLTLSRGRCYQATRAADVAAYAADPRRPDVRLTAFPTIAVARSNRWVRRAWRPLKRVCDVLGAAIALAVVLPIAPLALLAAWACGGGRPVFDRQPCRTRAGRSFTCLSLRLPPPKQTRPATRAVRWALAAVAADRWPQLMHVLRGDMALIGPPPSLRTPPARLAPGLIGLSQLMQRRRQHWTDTARQAYDRGYARGLSPAMDLKIFVATLLSRWGGKSA